MPVTFVVNNFTFRFLGKDHWFITETAARLAALQTIVTWNKYKDLSQPSYALPEVRKITKTYVFGDE